jgi:PAS domain S-box-containing protein
MPPAEPSLSATLFPTAPAALADEAFEVRLRVWRAAAVQELLGILAVLAAFLTLSFLPLAGELRPYVFVLTGGSAVAFAVGARMPGVSFRARVLLLVLPLAANAAVLFLARGIDPAGIANAFAASVLATLVAGKAAGFFVSVFTLVALLAGAAVGPIGTPSALAPWKLAYLELLGSVPLFALSVRGVALMLRRLEGVTRDTVSLVFRLSGEAEERARAVAAMEESEERFRLAFKTSPDPFSISRLDDGVMLAVNDGFTRTYGWTEQEVLGKRSLELGLWVDPADRARLVGLLRTRGSFRDEEVRHRRKDGQIRTVVTSGSMFTGRDGSTQVLASLHDVTEERRLARERKRLEEQFVQTQKIEAVGRLAGGVAHEFNNLLTSFGASAGFIGMDAVKGSELAAIAAELEAGVERGTQLTRQLLAFTQRQVLQPRPVDVNALLGDMRRVLERVLGEDVRVVLVPSHETARVLADPGQLEQVVLNLVVNARDAMPVGGRILIATAVRASPEAGPGEVLIEVTDEGRGIPPEVMEHLFEPFFSTKEDGTGLGLASVYGIVKQHRGAVEVDPGVGRGATFRVRLPAVDRVDPAEVATPGLPPRGSGQHVLLVDDEAAVRRTTERLLVRLGYHVIVASSGEEALRIVDGGARVDVVMTDVAMPAMSGGELVRRVLARRPGTPALLVSGYSADDILTPDLLQAGNLAFMPKPFSSEGLAEKMRELLGG